MNCFFQPLWSSQAAKKILKMPNLFLASPKWPNVKKIQPL
jgi:hypothetical protein